MKSVVGAALVTGVLAVNIPNVTLNNGIQMPMISLGTWQYDNDTAEAAVRLALQTGFNHIDTANNYHNQAGVGKGLVGFDRSTYFLTTKVPSTKFASSAYAKTTEALEEDLSLLGLDYVDLMLIHSPASSCKTTQEQWRALEDFYAAGKAKAIGVSNYCLSSFACIDETRTVKPALNQIEYHVGMGLDPTGIRSYHDANGIITQAYSPLGNGDSTLITGDLVTGIGQKHSWSGAQTSMRWLIDNGVPLTTKTDKQSHMQEDLAIFADVLADDEKSQLDTSTEPAGKPSWACSSAEVEQVQAGACTSDEQSALSDPQNVGTKANTCGTSSYNIFTGKFNHNKFNDCFSSSIGISATCAECYAATGEYGAKNCKADCILGWCKSGCLSCTEPAQETLATCTGFSSGTAQPCEEMTV